MVCRHCGAEIADKALICYRCGNATADAQRQPARLPTESRGWAGRVTPLLALVALVLAALYLGQAPSGEIPREASYGIIALAVLVLVMRQWQRWKRR
jgi:hypothetical protein